MIGSIVLFGLAGTRLTRAFQHEQVGELVRDPLMDWLEKPVMKRGRRQQVNVKLTAKKEWGVDLLECDHCTGFWLTLGCVLAYRTPIGRPLVMALAASAILSAVVDRYEGFAPEEV